MPKRIYKNPFDMSHRVSWLTMDMQ